MLVKKAVAASNLAALKRDLVKFIDSPIVWTQEWEDGPMKVGGAAVRVGEIMELLGLKTTKLMGSSKSEKVPVTIAVYKDATDEKTALHELEAAEAAEYDRGLQEEAPLPGAIWNPWGGQTPPAYINFSSVEEEALSSGKVKINDSPRDCHVHAFLQLMMASGLFGKVYEKFKVWERFDGWVGHDDSSKAAFAYVDSLFSYNNDKTRSTENLNDVCADVNIQTKTVSDTKKMSGDDLFTTIGDAKIHTGFLLTHIFNRRHHKFGNVTVTIENVLENLKLSMGSFRKETGPVPIVGDAEVTFEDTEFHLVVVSPNVPSPTRGVLSPSEQTVSFTDSSAQTRGEKVKTGSVSLARPSIDEKLTSIGGIANNGKLQWKPFEVLGANTRTAFVNVVLRDDRPFFLTDYMQYNFVSENFMPDKQAARTGKTPVMFLCGILAFGHGHYTSLVRKPEAFSDGTHRDISKDNWFFCDDTGITTIDTVPEAAVLSKRNVNPTGRGANTYVGTIHGPLTNNLNATKSRTLDPKRKFAYLQKSWEIILNNVMFTGETENPALTVSGSNRPFDYSPSRGKTHSIFGPQLLVYRRRWLPTEYL